MTLVFVRKHCLNSVVLYSRKGIMKHRLQSGSAHVVIIIILVTIVLGLLGFVFWQNFIDKKPSDTTTTRTQAVKTDSSQTKTLEIQPLGKTLNLTDASYSDIRYVATSVNVDDTNKYVIAVYSNDLNARLIADLANKNGAVDISQDYWKYSGNRAVYAYYYEPATGSMGPDMIDGVATNIINPEQRTSSSKLYVGFMGPGSPSTQALSSENIAFRDWVVKNLKY